MMSRGIADGPLLSIVVGEATGEANNYGKHNYSLFKQASIVLKYSSQCVAPTV